MKVSILYFRALSTCTVAFLAACGGSQLSIGAPGGLPQSRASRDLPLQGAPSSASLYGYKVLYRFTNAEFGNQPSAPLYNYKGTFYGTTVEGFGAVFSITKRGEVRLIHGFGGPPYDGGNPSSGLIEKNGTFYGETSWGGASCLGSYSSRCGTVFSVTPSGTENVLHSFGSGYDGVGPNGGLVDVNGTLYGTTGSGGAYDLGTVFSVTTSGTEKVLYSFGSKFPDGEWPMAGLDYLDGTFYGTTYYGGAYAPGCIFSIHITRGGHVTETLLHSFSGPDGDYPIAGLIDVKGVLYGTTVSGGEGSNGRGTVFSITTSGTENLLHTFAGGPYDGSDPYGNVTYNHGTFYGTTYTGGAYRGFRRLGGGTVFSVTASGAEKVLHSFGKVMNNGASPMAGVIYVRGTLYGTTQEGGHRGCGGSTRDCGTVFALTP